MGYTEKETPRSAVQEAAPALAVGAWVVLLAFFYSWASGTVIGSVFAIETAEAVHGTWQSGDPLSWVSRQSSHPFLYWLWMGLCPAAGKPAWLPGLVAWHALLIAAGIAGTAAYLRRQGAPRHLAAASILVLAGFPTVNLYSKVLTETAGAFAAMGLVLWLSAARERAGGALGGGIALGGIAAVGALAHPVMLPYAVAFFAGGFFLRRAGEGRSREMVAIWIALVAAVWYLGDENGAELFERLRVSVWLDAAETGAAWISFQTDFLAWMGAGIGNKLLYFVLAGWALAVTRSSRRALELAIPVLTAAAIYPATSGHGPSILLPVMPMVAAGMAVGLASLRPPWTRALSVLMVVFALLQIMLRTLGGFGEAATGRIGGERAASRHFELLWQSPELAAEVMDRCSSWAARLPALEPSWTLAVHPMEPARALRASLFHHVQTRTRSTERRLSFIGYDWSQTLELLHGITQDRPTFLVFSESLLRATTREAAPWLERAWAAESTLQETLPPELRTPPEDPLLTDPLSERYGVVEIWQTPAGKIWILANRNVWLEAEIDWPLGPLPRLPGRAAGGRRDGEPSTQEPGG